MAIKVCLFSQLVTIPYVYGRLVWPPKLSWIVFCVQNGFADEERDGKREGCFAQLGEFDGMWASAKPSALVRSGILA